MLFDTIMENTTESADLYSLEGVKESPYELGLSGALMHVYENECNWNKLMKATAIAEMRYYKETGRDLFVQEAGAFKSFIESAKSFFKKVIEKIKQIFKQFLAKINQFSMKDKEFVRKYGPEVRRKDIKDLEFTGYEKLKDGYKDPGFNFSNKVTSDMVKNFVNNNGLRVKALDSDTIDKYIEENRGDIIKKGPLTEAELRDEVKDILWGDKETFDVEDSHRAAALRTIEDTKQTVKDIEKNQKEIIKGINEFIKELDKQGAAVNKAYTSGSDTNKYGEINADNNKRHDEQNKNINNTIRTYKALANDYTVVFGMMAQAAKDANKQGRALCIKILGYNRKESATYRESTSNVDDIFNVDFA